MRWEGIRYADVGDLQIAYRVLGEGDLDVVFAFDWASDLELIWCAEGRARRVASLRARVLSR